MWKQHRYLVTVFLATVTAARTVAAADCRNTKTSAGLVTLPDGQFACAEASPDDLGKNYIHCVHGNAYLMPCPSNLRWDTTINVCNFPDIASCDLTDRQLEVPEPVEETTTRSPRTTKQAKRPRTTGRATSTTERAPIEDDSTSDLITTKRQRRTRAPDISATTQETIPDEDISTATTTLATRRRRRTTRTTSKTTTTQEDVPDEDTSTSTTATPMTTRRRRTTRMTGKTTTAEEEVPDEDTSTSTTTTLGTTRRARTTRRTKPTATAQTIKSSRSTRGRVTVNTTMTTTKPRLNSKPPSKETTQKAARSADCVKVATSEGTRTLKHGQTACASLGADQNESDLGGKFVTCSYGSVYTRDCQVGLKYDTATGLCNWPQSASCDLEEEIPEEEPSAPGQPTRAPRPQKPAGCNSNNCKLPDCFCFGDSPSSIPLEDTPRFVMLTFDDAVTPTLYNSYFRPLVVDNEYNLFNPNGCRTKSAFYVSHENTDYSYVQAIWNTGNEIGSHTIHHELPAGNKASDYPRMVEEIQGLKEKMLEATGNKTLVDSVVGFRSPYLRVAGDVQFQVLQDFNFLYDTSILNINILQGKKPHWPYTLDYPVGECINPPCPKKAYPGLWEVPLNGWIGDDKQGCSMIDSCVVGTSSWTATEDQWYRLFDRNFQDYFYPNKVPMPIFTHGFLYANYPNSYSGMTSWFQDLLQTHDDVWLVNPAQVINWMKNPLSNAAMIAQKWGC